MAKKTLIIVESPAKSNTISKYLGPEFLVSSSMGHIRDLNPKILSIDVKNGYKPHYEELIDKKHIITELKNLSKKSGKILLGPDPDREGEAIAFHLQEILKSINPEIFRILFHEITKKSIKQAVESPTEINLNKVNSQQMRRLLDRLAGYKISPILQKKIGGPLSAGRVQSIALKLIVEREKEIQAFISKEYWSIVAELLGSRKPPFVAKLEKVKNKKIEISNKDEADEILGQLKKNEYNLKHIERKLRNKAPLPPLITSSLQQEAFKRYKFPVKKTMKIAQELYEGIGLKGGETTGLITYMRTDSYRISNEAREQAKQVIESKFGKEFYPEKPNIFKTKAKTQDAHEAIRPTLPYHNPEHIKNQLSNTQFKIYQLIWERFFASQMKAATIEETVFKITNGDFMFIAKGERLPFKGFLRLIKTETEPKALPDLVEGEILSLVNLNPKQHFTKPPSRYTEATLVKILEEKGIGRPSTYTKIIDTLGKREYVFKEDRKFVPTFLGTKVVDYLEEHFKDIMNYNFTAEVEKKLDMVSEGKLDWETGIDEFYKKLEKNLIRVKSAKKVELTVDKTCPECGGNLLKKYSHKTKGWFIGCTNFPECKYTEKDSPTTHTIKKDEIINQKCPQCDKPLVKRYSNKTRQYFIGCSGYPECNYIKKQKVDLGNCPLCGKPLKRKFSRKTRRFFIGCSAYPACNFIPKRSDKK